MSESQLPTLLNEDSFSLLEKRSLTLSKSSIIPVSLRNRPADIMVIMMMAHEMDIPPMQAINGINVINGRPTISPQLMIALIRRKIPDAIIKVEEGVLTCSCFMARSSSKVHMDQGFTAKWDMEKATKMGLAAKDNYLKQPQTMIRWRTVGEAARQIFPDILSGLYLPDEFVHEDGSMIETNEHGEIKSEIEDENEIISKDDARALVALMRERNWVPSQLKNVCMSKYQIGDSSKLTKKQYKELIEMINTTDPTEIAE